MSIGKSSVVRPIIIGLILVTAIGMTVYLRTGPSHRPVPPELQGVLRPAPKPLQPFSLIDHRGEPFNLEHMRGKWTLPLGAPTRIDSVARQVRFGS